MTPLVPIGASSSLITLKEPGYFDAGVAIIPGVADGAEASIEVRAWYANVNGTIEDNIERSEIHGKYSITVNTGIWNPNSGLEPKGPSIQFVRPLLITGIPEPSTISLGILGFGIFVFRLMSTSRLSHK